MILLTARCAVLLIPGPNNQVGFPLSLWVDRPDTFTVLTFDAAVKLVSQCCRGHDPKVRSCAMRCLQVLLSRAGNDEHALAAVDPTLLDGIISSAMAALNEGKLESIRTAALDLLLAVLQRSEQPKARLDDVHDLMFRLASDTNPDVIDKCSDIKRLIQRRKAAGATRA